MIKRYVLAGDDGAGKRLLEGMHRTIKEAEARIEALLKDGMEHVELITRYFSGAEETNAENDAKQVSGHPSGDAPSA